MAKPKKKGKKGLIIVIVAGVLVLAGGGVVGAAVMGLINIPGLTSKKQSASLYGEGNELYGEGGELLATNDSESTSPDTTTALDGKDETDAVQDDPTDEPETEIVAQSEPEPIVDPEVGAKKLAKVWNEMKPAELVNITVEYQDTELARVLKNMDSSQVAKLLAIMDPKVAARVSKEMEAQGSVLPPPAS